MPYSLLPASLTGLDCLEIGTGNGYWAFQMERRGARSVTATDIGSFADTDFSRLHGPPHPCPHRTPVGEYGETFRVAAVLMGSRVSYRVRSVYELRPDDPGTFDVVSSGSMLMHLFAPLLALQRIADVCRNTLVLTTQTDVRLDGESIALYEGHRIPYVHFIPSPTCLVNMVNACGFEQVVRGPTFAIWHRDRRKHPDPVVHTAIVAHKDAVRPSVLLPPPRLLSDAERRTIVDVVSGPRVVGPGQTFDLVVNIRNDSSAPWRPPSSEPICVVGDVGQPGGGSRLGSSRVKTAGMPIADYLPPGLSTLVRLRVTAPTCSGLVSVVPALVQGRHTFASNIARWDVRVDSGAEPPPFPAQSDRFASLLRTVRRTPGFRSVKTAVARLRRW